jgi:hypothetical protein
MIKHWDLPSATAYHNQACDMPERLRCTLRVELSQVHKEPARPVEKHAALHRENMQTWNTLGSSSMLLLLSQPGQGSSRSSRVLRASGNCQMAQPAPGSCGLPRAMVTYVVAQDAENLKGPVGVYRWIWVSRRVVTVVFTTYYVELAEGVTVHRLM